MRPAVLALAILVSCSDSSSTTAPDAGQPDAGLAALTCNQLGERAVALVATLDKVCNTVDDCTLVGFIAGSCNGSPELIPQGGAALSKTGAANADLAALAAEFQKRCSTAPCSSTNSCGADTGPQLVACTSKVCTGSLRSCNMAYDAGVH
jgi:hypothetical protein